MSYFSRYRCAVAAASFAALSLCVSCAKDSNPVRSDGFGMIEVRARLAGPTLAKGAALNAAAQTVAERLVIEVSGGGLAAPDTIESKLDLSRPSLIDTVKKVPIGKNRRVSIWAVGKDGAVTHIDETESHPVNIETGVVTPVFATLIPAAGSIYLQLIELPTNTTVRAVFTALDGKVIAENTVARATRTFVSLDNIPHLTAGVLKVEVINAQGETIFIATNEMTFNARGDNNIDLRFTENNGMIAFDISIYEPGVTTGSYNFKTHESKVEETGELIITEIMWNATNDNYIELFNPSNETQFFDTLTTDVNGTVYHFRDVNVAARGYLVIGRQNLPYVNIYPPRIEDLPIVSTGIWITIKRKNGTVIDRVIAATSTTNTIGWPQISTTGRKSMELARDKYDATENNYGKNWSAATALIEGAATNQYGTPGR